MICRWQKMSVIVYLFITKVLTHRATFSVDFRRQQASVQFGLANARRSEQCQHKIGVWR